MAIYIAPSRVNETMNALKTWNQAINEGQRTAATTGLQQLKAIQMSGGSEDDIRKAQNRIMSLGNPLAALSRGGGADMAVQSAQDVSGGPGGGGTPRAFQPSGTDVARLGKQQEREKGLMAYAGVQDTRNRVNELRSELSNFADVDVNSKDPALSGDIEVKKRLLNEMGMAENRLAGLSTDLAKNKVFGLREYGGSGKAEEVLGKQSKKAIEEGEVNIGQALTGGQIDAVEEKGTGAFLEGERKKVESIEGDINTAKNDFIAKEEGKIKDVLSTGGPLTGDETSMRAKSLRDYQALSARAGNDLGKQRTLYNRYTQDQKSIDARYNKKGFYQPFEKEFASQFGKKTVARSGGGRRGGSGGVGKGDYKMYGKDPNTGQIREMFVTSKNLSEAKRQFKEQFKFDPGNDVSIREKDKNLQASTAKEWRETFTRNLLLKEENKAKIAQFRKDMNGSSLTDMDLGNESTDAVLNMLKIKNFSREDIDNDDMQQLLMKLTDSQAMNLFRALDKDISTSRFKAKDIIAGLTKAKGNKAVAVYINNFLTGSSPDERNGGDKPVVGKKNRKYKADFN